MAVYEFECRACGERFQMTMPMAEHRQLKGRPPACPKCGKRQTAQRVTTFACRTPSGY